MSYLLFSHPSVLYYIKYLKYFLHFCFGHFVFEHSNVFSNIKRRQTLVSDIKIE